VGKSVAPTDTRIRKVYPRIYPYGYGYKQIRIYPYPCHCLITHEPENEAAESSPTVLLTPDVSDDEIEVTDNPTSYAEAEEVVIEVFDVHK
jgi:hypothetical protein